MDPRSALIGTVEDLRSRSGLTATEYDLVQAAGLMRRLVLDGQRLVDQANCTFRLSIEYHWHRVFRLSPRGLWFWDTISDPAMFSPVLADMDGAGTGGASAGRPRSGPLKKFLTEPVIVRHSEGESRPPKELEHVTVRQLLDEFANRQGGVHVDTSKPTEPPLLADALNSPTHAHIALGAIGRVVVRSLEPLVALCYYRTRLEAEATTRQTS